MDSNNSSFQYSYSAKEQKEIESIRRKYLAPEEDRMARLRRLDASVSKKATVYSLIIGIIGALVMGVGMSCCMAFGGAWFIPGIIIGIVGIAVATLAYPVYDRVLRKEKEKIAPEILRLTDELMR